MDETSLPQRSVNDVIGLLDEALEASKQGPSACVLAFDADGTLWEGDVGLDVFEALLASERVLEAAHDALKEEARTADVEPGADVMITLKRLYDAFNAERYHESRAFAMMAWAFAGWTQNAMTTFIDDVLAKARIDTRVNEEARPIMAYARKRGLETVVVSASPRAAVVRGVASLGVAPESVFAMTPAVENGLVLPRLSGAATYGEGKVEALLQHRPDRLLLGGFGDTSYDVAFLKRARVAVAIRPKKSLFLRASEAPHLVSLIP